MPSAYRARWIVPIERPPIEDGWLAIDDGVITEIGEGRPPRDAEDLGDTALLPGLVNAHTHLELSNLAGRVPPASSMVAWIQRLFEVRGRSPSPAGSALETIRDAVASARAAGTALIGDISNALDTLAPLRESPLDAVVFHEILGFNAPDPDGRVAEAWARVEAAVASSNRGSRGHGSMADVRSGLVAHAPYSVSPALFAAIARARRSAPLSVHLGESAAEIEFLETGRGPFRSLLQDLGAWNPSWQVPTCDPAEYLDRCGYLESGSLVVHGTHLSRAAIERLRERDVTLVMCPRSNRWVGEGDPPIAMFYESGVRVAIGTDSLASVETLGVFDELAHARRLAPGVPASRLLESATRVGAGALGFGATHGVLAPGQRAPVLAVRVTAGVGDVEEYLVSGVPSDDVSWIGGRF